MAEAIVVITDGADQAALISLLQAAGDLVGASEASAVVAVGMVQRTLEGVGIHIRQSSGMTLWAAPAV